MSRRMKLSMAEEIAFLEARDRANCERGRDEREARPRSVTSNASLRAGCNARWLPTHSVRSPPSWSERQQTHSEFRRIPRR
jgi:hypothetical protein